MCQWNAWSHLGSLTIQYSASKLKMGPSLTSSIQIALQFPQAPASISAGLWDPKSALVL